MTASTPRRAAGTGSIRSKGTEKWLLQRYLGRDEQGRPRYQTSTVQGSYADAERELAGWLVVTPPPVVTEGGDTKGADNESTLGRTFEPENVLDDVTAENAVRTAFSFTVRQLVADYLANREQAGCSPRSLDYVRSTATNHLNPAYGDREATQVTLRMVNDLVRKLAAQQLAPATVRRIVGVLSAAYSHAIRTEQLDRNPCALVTLPSVRNDDQDAPDPATLNRLLDADAWTPELWRDWPREAFRTYLVVSALTGARRGEILALKWRDIDTHAGTIHFRSRIVESTNGVELLPGTKTGRGRKITADLYTLTTLAAHKSRHEGNSCHDTDSEAFVFGGDQPWRPSAVSNKYRRLRDDVGATSVKLHHLRHAAATRMISQGVPITTVSKRLGHSRTSTTLDIYAHAIPADDGVAAESMAGWLQQSA